MAYKCCLLKNKKYGSGTSFCNEYNTVQCTVHISMPVLRVEGGQQVIHYNLNNTVQYLFQCLYYE